MSGAISLGQPSGRTALAIAAFIARPATSLRPGAIDRWLADVGGQDLRPMLGARPVQGLVNRYLSQATGASRLEVDTGFLSRLRSRAGLVTAMELALAPFARLDRLKLYVVGAICRDAVRGALFRRDREVLAALLGPDVRDFAARQAATFYPALGGLAPQVLPALRAADGTGFADHPVSAAAGRVIAGALAVEAPLAAAILAIRESGSLADTWPVDLTTAQATDVLRLWQREAR
jgi:hypothetical protein